MTHTEIILIAEAAVFAVILIVIRYRSHRQMRDLENHIRRFRETHDVEELETADLGRWPEIRALVVYLVQELKNGTITQLKREKAEYLALQSQITPHFLFNTLEDIRSDALEAGMRDIARVIGALSTHLRYVLESDDLVWLEDELDNVEDYYTIQKYRFGDRLNLVMELPNEHLGCPKVKIPKLTLQPILENAISHGLEGKLSDGEIRIIVETTQNDLLIGVRDNGAGMTQEKLRELNNSLRNRKRAASGSGSSSDGKRHNGIALVNVDSRLRLIFGENYGIHIYSMENVGTEVQIRIPLHSQES
jgi:sensor histidine kinase YesM